MAEPLILGWEEWVALPELGLPAVKAKVDTGARTSALHASSVERIGSPSAARVRFVVHPVPGRADIAIACEAPLVDEREVVSSNGETERRTVVRTRLAIDGRSWPIEVTLTNRESMGFRMLLGREALGHGVLVDPRRAYLRPRLSYRLYQGSREHSHTERALRIVVIADKAGAPSNARLSAAAAANGHTLEIVALDDLRLTGTGHDERAYVGNAPLRDCDAVLVRVEPGRLSRAAQVVRVLERHGAYAPAPADALEACGSGTGSLGVLRALGLAVEPPSAAGEGDVDAEAVRRRVLVVGEAAVAVTEEHSGRFARVRGRRAEREREIAVAAARALGLRLASIDVSGSGGRVWVTGVSTRPVLSRFETVTGVDAVGAVLADIEQGADRAAHA